MDRPVFDAASREKYRNPPAPPGYQCLNPPDIVMKCPKYEKIVINFEELEEIGLFDVDVETLDNFVLNLSSDDDEEEGEIATPRSEKKPLSKVDEKTIEEKSSNQQIEEKKQTELRKKETEVKSTEQRTGKKAIDKVIEDAPEENWHLEARQRTLCPFPTASSEGLSSSSLPTSEVTFLSPSRISTVNISARCCSLPADSPLDPNTLQNLEAASNDSNLTVEPFPFADKHKNKEKNLFDADDEPLESDFDNEGNIANATLM